MEKITKENKKNGEILLGFRKQNKLTQKALAEIIGRDQRDISKYEVGRRAIPQNSIDLLKEKYGLKLKSTGKVIHAKRNPKAVDIETNTKKIKMIITNETSFFPKGDSFGKKLVSLREHLGMSQKQFAKKYKFNNTYLCKLEKDKISKIDIISLKAMKKDNIDVMSLI